MSTLQKIKNPFIKHRPDAYNCFGCSPHNPIGFQLTFYSDGKQVLAHWLPQPQFEGYKNVVHGGIQATLMDEIASWYVYALLDTAGVTASMNVQYHQPLFASGGRVEIVAELQQLEGRKALIATEIINTKGVVCSSAVVEYFLFPPKLARLKYGYPGKAAFWN